MAVLKLEFREVVPELWPDLERLFESRGGPKYCWCMVWRGSGEERADRDSRKSGMRRRVEEGVPVGILGYSEGKPVAWCSIAPRTTYRNLGGMEAPEVDPERVWSVVCFFLKREYRQQGVMAELIRASVAHARARGAKVVEAYPVKPDSPSYRFMGFVSSFRAAGFQEVGRAGRRRHVMQLELE